MSNKRKGRTGGRAVQPTPRLLADRLAEAAQLARRKQWDEAHDLLADLSRRYPNRPEVLAARVNLAVETQDTQAYQAAGERLLQLTPNDPDLALGLAHAYVANTHPALALRAFQRFLDRWPDDPRAAETRQLAAGLETTLREILPGLGLEGEDAMELAAMHEEIQAQLNQGQWQQVRRLADQYLRRKPDMTAVLNNLSLAYFFEGNFDQAIATARQVLALQPDNYHALGNLVRYLCLGGQMDQIQPIAEQLKALSSPAESDLWIKKAEAFSFLGDDQAVLDAYAAAGRAVDLDAGGHTALLHHLAAVAMLRQGREKDARNAWRKARTQAPWLQIVQANLDDLRKPAGERHAPWPFELAQWLPQATLDDLVRDVAQAAQRSAQTARKEQERFLQRHPELVRLAPLLLDHGDPTGRELVVRLGLATEHPALIETLASFALSQRGPDTLRHEAVQLAQEAGALPIGRLRMWLKGEWREIIAAPLEVYGEPDRRHGPQVEELDIRAMELIRSGAAAEAEPLLKQALELEPDAPDLWNNLAAAYMQQKRHDEANTIIQRIFEQHPDYLFGRVNMANLRVQEGRLDEALALLASLAERTRLHISEFTSLMQARLNVAVARRDADSAELWLRLWEDVDPDNEAIEQWRERVEAVGMLRALERLKDWQPRRRKKRGATT